MAFKKYLEEREFKPNTINTYTTIIIQYITWFRANKDKEFDDFLLRGDFLSFKEFLEEVRENAPASLKLKTIAMKHFNEFLLLQKAQTNKVIFKSDNINLYRSTFDTYIPSAEEVAQFVRDIYENRKLRDYVIVKVLVETGIKISEAVNLKKESISYGNKILYIYNHNTITRTIPLSQELVDLLLEYMRTRKVDSDYLFVNTYGKPICRSRVNQIFKMHSKEITPQSLRHYYCIRRIEAGESLNEIMKCLGNTSVQFMKKYEQLVLIQTMNK